MTGASGRIMTLEEANTLYTSSSTISKSVGADAYWLGSAHLSDRTWYVNSSGYPIHAFNYSLEHGIRPVILVNTSDL